MIVHVALMVVMVVVVFHGVEGGSSERVDAVDTDGALALQ